MKPGKKTLHGLGVLALVAAALGLVVLIVLGILSARTTYFEQRNLRELDRVTAELTSTSQSLAQTATLHFVPQQLHFSLSRWECLIATTRIVGARQQLINITYTFTDPNGIRDVARWYANHPPPPGAGALPGSPAVTSRSLPQDLCGYQRPLGLPAVPGTIDLEPERIRLERSVPLVNLLWPMTVQGRPGPQEAANCVEGRRPEARPATGGDVRSFVRDCFIAAAVEDMADVSYSYNSPEQLRQAVARSVNAAIDSNSVRVGVSTAMSALDLESALENFDAIQIIGTVDHQPRLLFQAGRVPVSNEGDSIDQAQALSLVLSLSGRPAGNAAGANRAAQPPQTNRQGDFLNESRVLRTADLILFQRTLPTLAGLPCNPCRIVGIVERGKFNSRARRIDGGQATIFLIAVLTLLGLIPLVQLKLRKRLDPTGRAGQYLIWLSLTLLSACAAVSILALWTAAASRSAGAAYADAAISHVGQAFRAELTQSLQLVGRIGRDLGPSDAVFPAPVTLPAEEHLTPSGQYSRNRTDPVSAPVIATLSEARRLAPRAAIIDTVATFRADGFTDRNTARVAVGRFPAYGQNISDRDYFIRARNRDYDHITLRCGAGQAPSINDFILDRVFARPDGAPRAIFVMPAKRGCLSRDQATVSDADVRRQEAKLNAPGSAPAEAAPIHGEDRPPFYNPTRREFVVAAGTLMTFMRASLAPGFRYAVVDPDRRPGEPDVLYHSLPAAELVERFEQEIDDPGDFRALVQKALTSPGQGASASGQGGGLRMDTRYHARPARLTVARLHPDMDWLLVIIEDRDDAGFAVWRAATFGYTIWFLAALVFAVAMLLGHIHRPAAMDRRPGLWLWPAGQMEGFTPPRLQRKADLKSRLQEGAALRDRHVLWVGLAALIGLAATDGWSRVAFAFAAAMAVLAGRAYFQGMTASDAAPARRSDRRVVIVGLVALALTVPAFWTAMEADYALRGFLGARSSWVYWMENLRFLPFAAAIVILLKCFLTARAHTFDTLPAPGESADGVRRLGPWLQSWKARRRLPDVGWMVALIVLGGVPAAAGYLDSYDEDRILLVERAQQISGQAALDRRQEFGVIDIARRAKLSDEYFQQIVSRPVIPEWLQFGPGPAGPRAGLLPDTSRCVTFSCLAMRYLDLREQALEHSDFAPYSLADALNPSRGPWRLVVLPLVFALPMLVFVLILLLFRRQYFSQPPLLSPGKDPDFDPPLSLTRAQFAQAALLEAAAGRAPQLPFAPAGGNRHLILGVSLEVRDEWTPDRAARLGDLDSIQWIDLLDPPKDVTPNRHAVVIGNLDLALQIPDEALVERTFNIINAVSGSAGGRARGKHQVFLLADIDPLDRIALLWEKQGVNEHSRLVDGWRWAELLQDFTLFPVQGGEAVPAIQPEPHVLRRIREELGVLDTNFAHELRDQLYARMSAALAQDRRLDSAAEADRITSFITEQMSDHYYKLWASSSEEERVILYSIARDCHLKMNDNRALRSLLARGLLVRGPEYRLINRSFARYVRRVGEALCISASAAELGGTDRIWPLIRYPLAAVAASGVLLLQFVAPSSANSAVGALPALLAFVPALLGKLFQDRGATT